MLHSKFIVDCSCMDMELRHNNNYNQPSICIFILPKQLLILKGKVFSWKKRKKKTFHNCIELTKKIKVHILSVCALKIGIYQNISTAHEKMNLPSDRLTT